MKNLSLQLIKSTTSAAFFIFLKIVNYLYADRILSKHTVSQFLSCRYWCSRLKHNYSHQKSTPRVFSSQPRNNHFKKKSQNVGKSGQMALKYTVQPCRCCVTCHCHSTNLCRKPKSISFTEKQSKISASCITNSASRPRCALQTIFQFLSCDA